MNKEDSAFEGMWAKIILPSIEFCKNEMNKEFVDKTNIYLSDMDTYKEKLEIIYKRKREWLKREYLPNEKNPILDFHKLSAIMCRSIVGVKPFCFDVARAEKIFLDISKSKGLSREEKIYWQINNVYVNYKLAFLVAEGIVFVDLLYWAQKKINDIKDKYTKDDIENNIDDVSIKLEVYSQFILLMNSKEKRLYMYEGSVSHDNYINSTIIALMKNDYLKRDFDYLQFALSMFQWQEYTKKQHIYDVIQNNNYKITLSDLI